MPTSRSEVLGGHRSVASPDVSLALPRAVFWALLGVKLIASWGVQWDVEWHVRVGRDTFWIAPHLMTYAGVAGSVLLSWGMLAWYTAGGGRAPNPVHILGIRGTRGFQLAAWGSALIVVAAPIDDLWHRLFGLDVTLWSPPHLLGILGGLVSSAACLTIAWEVHPAQPAARALAQLLAGAALFRGLALVAQPAVLLVHSRGGIWFYSPAILSALLLPVALVAVAILTARRWSPTLLLLVVIATTVLGHAISDAGFDWLRPVSVIDAEIAREPDSPIAVATRIARQNGEKPGRGSLAMLVASLLATAAMSATDARRRPVGAALAYGVAVFGLWGWMLGHAPAFSARAPGAWPTLAALAVVLLCAVAAGRAGRALAGVLGPAPGARRGRGSGGRV